MNEPSSNSPQLRSYLLALIAVCLWASAFPSIRIALQSFDPIPLAALRFLVAGCVWLMWFAFSRPRLPNLKDMGRFFLCGLIGIMGYNICLNLGQTTVSSGAASFIVNTAPVLIAILAILFLKEAFTPRQWLGTLISFSGVGLIASGQPGGFAFGEGASFVFGAAVCGSVYTIIQKPLVVKYGAQLTATMVMTSGAICLSPWLPIALKQATEVPVWHTGTVVYLGLFPAAIGYGLWGQAQADFGASRSANFLYLVPPISVVIAYFLTAEIPQMMTLLGGTLAILGVLIVNRMKRPPKAT